MPAPMTAKSAHEQSEIKSGDTTGPSERSKTASSADLQKYYRIRKISGYLNEIIEVSVDESVNVPKVISKQDTRELLLVKLEDYICNGAKKKR